MKPCLYCKEPMWPEQFRDRHAFARAKFCNKTCYQAYHAFKVETLTCKLCGKQYKTTVGSGRPVYCSSSCRYEDAKRPGNSYVGSNGYRYIKIHDRIGQTKGEYELEHRLVMEEFLNRPLAYNEIVHHKDGDKLNNAIDNLELLTSSAHQRLHHDEAKTAIGYHPINSPESVAKRTNTRWGNQRDSNMVLSVHEMHRTNGSEPNRIRNMAETESNDCGAAPDTI